MKSRGGLPEDFENDLNELREDLEHGSAIIVGVVFQSKWQWYVSPADLWHLDQVKYRDFFVRSVVADLLWPQAGKGRFGIAVVTDAKVEKFLERTERYRFHKETLATWMRDKQPRRTGDDILEFQPKLLVDFDRKVLLTTDFQGLNLWDKCVPDGWEARADLIVDEVPAEERYWIIDGFDYSPWFDLRPTLMTRRITYAEDIIVGVIFQARWQWYVSPKEYWILDEMKWREPFLRAGVDTTHWPEPGTERFGIAVVTDSNAAEFLEHMKRFRMDCGTLSTLMQLQRPQRTINDILEFNPSLLVDFDKKRLITQYPESLFFEDYVPDGWEAAYDGLADEVPRGERYWMLGELSYFDFFDAYRY